MEMKARLAEYAIKDSRMRITIRIQFMSAMLVALATVVMADEPQPAGLPTSVPPSAIAPVRLALAPRTDRELALPLAVWTEHRDLPEPLAIHVLRIDLQCPALEVIAMPADDPDGDGPAQAALTAAPPAAALTDPWGNPMSSFIGTPVRPPGMPGTGGSDRAFRVEQRSWNNRFPSDLDIKSNAYVAWRDSALGFLRLPAGRLPAPAVSGNTA